MLDPNDFKMERLKYVLKQQELLNDYSHKYLTFFQSITTTIITAMVAIFVSWKSLTVDVELARVSIRALELLLGATGGFVVVVLMSCVFSWVDYRKEEVSLLNQCVSEGFRSNPSFKSAWRWFETWILLIVIVSTIGIIIFIEQWAIPLIV